MKKDVLTLEYGSSTETIKAAAQKILVAHGLDFHILKLPLLARMESKDDAGDVIGITEYPTEDFGLFNSKTLECLNTVKKGYRVSDNDEVVELVLRGIEGFGDLSVSKAGALNGGRKVFIQLEINGMARVGNDDIKRYVTVIDSNDGSTGLSVGIGDLTMSCQNQFFRFYKAGELKMRHASSMDAKIQELPNLITLALTESMRLVNAYKQMEKTPASRDLVHALSRQFFGVDRSKADNIKDLTPKALANLTNFYSHVDFEMADKGENLWGLHSGTTSWTTHQKQVPNREFGRLESLMTGTNYNTNQASLQFALEHAGITL